MMFIVTQMHGIGLSRVARWIISMLFILSLIYVYSERGWSQINEIFRIPMIDYILVFILSGLIFLIIKFNKKLQ